MNDNTRLMRTFYDEVYNRRNVDFLREHLHPDVEGRGPGTKGLQMAADHIAERFQSLGLAGGGVDGGFTRPFDLPIDTKVVKEKTRLVLSGPDGQKLELELLDQAYETPEHKEAVAPFLDKREPDFRAAREAGG